jgi:hypothetical protein
MRRMKQMILLLVISMLCASCATQIDPLGLPTAPLPDRKVERIIKRLNKVEYPIEREVLCARIGLPSGYLMGRTMSEDDPPFEWFTIQQFHPRYGLKYKFDPKVVNDKGWIVYEMKIWKKEKPEGDL